MPNTQIKVVNNENLSTFAQALAAKVPLKSDIPTKVSDLANDRGYTSNEGTITGISMNGASLGTSGNINLGTVVTNQNIDKIPYVSQAASSSVALDSNKLYDFGTLSSAITITLNPAPSGYVSEHMIRFIMGDGGSITLPSGVLYLNNQTPSYTIGRTYEIDIMNNLAVVGEFY